MPAALRYTFEFDTSNLRVLRRRTLDRQTVASDDWGPVSGESGFWVELRDAAGSVLYRRVMDDPAFRLEGPLDNNGTIRTLLPPTGRKGTFSVVVPYTPNAQALVVFASRPPDAAAAAILTVTVQPV